MSDLDPDTLAAHCLREVRAAFEALALPDLELQAPLLQALTTDYLTWGKRRVSDPRLPSGISHGWPWGLSLAFGQGEPELRLLVEPQGPSGTARAYVDEARRWVGCRSSDAYFDQACPAATGALDDAAPFRCWLGLRLPTHDSLMAMAIQRTKLYQCPSLVLGLSAEDYVDQVLQNALGPGGPECQALVRDGLMPEDRLTVVASWPHRPGRAQLYVHQPRALPRRLDRWSALASGGAWGDAAALAAALLPAGAAPDWLTSLGFEAGALRPTTAAHHLPVRRLGLDDAWISGRLSDLCTELGGDPKPYEALRQHPKLLALRHHFVSIQRKDGQLRLTAYFVPSVGR